MTAFAAETTNPNNPTYNIIIFLLYYIVIIMQLHQPLYCKVFEGISLLHTSSSLECYAQ